MTKSDSSSIARGKRLARIALSLCALAAWPSAAQAPTGALAGIQSGLWQLRSVGGTAQHEPRSVCIREARQMLQLLHEGQSCTPRVISDTGGATTVRYQCQGGGWGQTTVRVETPRLVNIDTQGIAGGGPFHQVLEARRTGDCS